MIMLVPSTLVTFALVANIVPCLAILKMNVLRKPVTPILVVLKTLSLAMTMIHVLMMAVIQHQVAGIHQLTVKPMICVLQYHVILVSVVSTLRSFALMPTLVSPLIAILPRDVFRRMLFVTMTMNVPLTLVTQMLMTTKTPASIHLSLVMMTMNAQPTYVILMKVVVMI
jgi:hypothetical protein